MRINLLVFQKKLCKITNMARQMNYIICGVEHIGIRLIEFLQSLNESISIITLDRNENLLKSTPLYGTQAFL